MKTLTQILSESAKHQADASVALDAPVDPAWLDVYTNSLAQLVAESCVNHVKTMPSRGGFRFAERASYVNQEDVVHLINGLFKS